MNTRDLCGVIPPDAPDGEAESVFRQECEAAEAAAAASIITHAATLRLLRESTDFTYPGVPVAVSFALADAIPAALAAKMAAGRTPAFPTLAWHAHLDNLRRLVMLRAVRWTTSDVVGQNGTFPLLTVRDGAEVIARQVDSGTLHAPTVAPAPDRLTVALFVASVLEKERLEKGRARARQAVSVVGREMAAQRATLAVAANGGLL